MADVTGPINTLPGSGHALPSAATCDYHDDRPAVCRIQGETDSFGSEMHDLCAECRKQHLEYRRSNANRSGRCDWCKTDTTDLRDARCYDEGMCGPVYRVCGACIRRRDERLQQELDDWNGKYGWDD